MFADNEIDFLALPRLTEGDLKELGLPIGARRRFQALIEKLAEQASPARQTDAPKTTADAERRQLTVMFCDLAGSTELSQQLDPEDLREINRAYQDACKTAIERYEGYVARYMGDGVLAYFGYPQAHEDDPERAIRAGLGVVESIVDLNASPRGGQDVELRVRVGIATGPVVVGDLIGEGASQESAVVGETPNLAARLQSLAADNAVVISPATHNLAGKRYECDDLGPHQLRGIARPVRAWRVIAPISAESRFAATHRAELTPLVGREHEIGLLCGRWSQAKEGDGQVVLLSGEAGIGKSRLTQILQERTAIDGPARLRYQCSPYYTNSALHPIIERLERVAGFAAEDSNERKCDKLESLLVQKTTDFETVVALFAVLLSIPSDGRYPPVEMTPERQKEATLDALVGQMEIVSHERPVLLIFEDAHWADPSSLELLELAIARAQHLCVMVVITFRPEFTSPWTGHTHVTSLTLNRFARGLALEMASKVTGDKLLPYEIQQQIIERTDGVPLFVEELTKTILESGSLREESDRYVLSGPMSEISIPMSLHDSLMERLDRLGPVKEVAQAGAVIGREFNAKLLEAVSPLDDAELQTALGTLEGSGLIFRTGRASAGRHYLFKHALVQNAAYESLLKSRRQQLHARIAGALEGSSTEIAETEPELIAHHYTAGGMPEPAVRYWRKAGRRASVQSSSPEAVGHYSNGLKALSGMSLSPERDKLELDIQLALIPCLTATKGFANDEATAASTRARGLCEQYGESEKLRRVLVAEGIAHYETGQYQLAKEVGLEVVSLGEQLHDSGCVQSGLGMVGWGEIGLGEFSFVESLMKRMLELYDPDDNAARITFDDRVNALTLQTVAQWFRGFPDQSVSVSEEAFAYARALNHDSSLAWALTWAGAFPAALRRDTAATERFSTELIALSDDQRNPVDLSWGRVFAGWVIGKRGELDRGVSILCEGLSDLAASFRIFRTTHLALLAELYVDGGKLNDASTTLQEANNRMSHSDERLWNAEILRLEAKLCVRASGPEGFERAQTLLTQAIQTAHRQGAKSLELRSSIALARLWQRQDKRRAAHNIVAPVYDWFTEGFDTPDLKEAKSLLSELS